MSTAAAGRYVFDIGKEGSPKPGAEIAVFDKSIGKKVRARFLGFDAKTGAIQAEEIALKPRAFDWAGLIEDWSSNVPEFGGAFHWSLELIERAIGGEILATSKNTFRWREQPELGIDEMADTLELLARETYAGPDRVSTIHECSTEIPGEGIYRVRLDVELRPTRTHESYGPNGREVRFEYSPRANPVAPVTPVVNVNVPEQPAPVVNVNIDNEPMSAKVSFKRRPDGTIESATIEEQAA